MKTAHELIVSAIPVSLVCALSLGIFSEHSARVLADDLPKQGAIQAESPTQQPKLPVDSSAASTLLGIRLRQADDGVYISHVRRDSPAHFAGMRPGDQIQSIQGSTVSSIEDVSKALQKYVAGHAIKVIVKPAAGPRHLTVEPTPAGDQSNQRRRAPMIGVTLTDRSGQVIVSQLYVGGPAEAAGIRSGDRIEAVDGRSIDSETELRRLFGQHKPGDQVDLLIGRNGWRRHVSVTLAAHRSLPGSSLVSEPSQTHTRLQLNETSKPAADGGDWLDEQNYENITDPFRRALYTDFGD